LWKKGFPSVALIKYVMAIAGWESRAVRSSGGAPLHIGKAKNPDAPGMPARVGIGSSPPGGWRSTTAAPHALHQIRAECAGA
jgi:hypothetical protein